METLTHMLDTLYASEHWPLTARMLRIALYLVLLWGGWMLWRGPVAATRKPAPDGLRFRLFLAGLYIAFALLLAHQAVWQLAGQYKPEFVAFMQLHDRRTFNPAHRIQRGRITDRNGIILAESVNGRKGPVRIYPLGPAAAHVVGYTHPLFGSDGMEQAGNAILMGASFTSLAEWKALGRGLFDPERTITGRDLVLTLDARLQNRAFDLLGSRRGAAILMNPINGDVLALVSSPSYNPNRIDRGLFAGERGQTVLLNRATHGLYPPGSTFKILTAALALEQGFSGTIFCPAEGWTTSPANPKIRDYGYYAAQEKHTDWAGYGALDLGTALAKSSNVFFARLGVQLGLAPLAQTAKAFHLGKWIPLYRQYGLSLDARTGRFPDLSEGDRYGLAQVSIGQGRVLVTPFFMAMATAAVANGGIAPKPRLALSDPPSAMPRSLSPEAAGKLAHMMRRVMTEGTGRRLASSPLAPAGKTGTAENPHGAAHSWFAGFAPFHQPRLAVCVLVEEGGFGSGSALHIANDLLEAARAAGYLGDAP